MSSSQRQTNDGITGEQAALRRVATLVARAAPPEQVFAAVTEEAGRLLGARQATMSRYVPDGTIVVAAWNEAGAAFPVGSQWSLGGRNVPTLVFQTGRPARTDDDADVADLIAKTARRHGLLSLVGVPISVEGRVWGVMLVGSMREKPLPPGTEARLAAFTELAATAIANAQAHVDLRGVGDEQAALRRVATLVAYGMPPSEVFAAVAAEVGRLLGTDFTFLSRYSAANAATIVGAWAMTGTAGLLSAGSRWILGGRNLHTMVFRTHRPARMDDYAGASGPVAEAARNTGIRSAVAVPISVEGRLWGAIVVSSVREEPLPASTEVRLAAFTELAATAIANTHARVELRGFADEQAALRRVATLVARGAPPEDVLAAVSEEAGRLLNAHRAVMSRYGPEGAIAVAAWSRSSPAVAAGTQWTIGGRNLHTMVSQTHRPARMDDYTGATGPAAEARERGVRSGVAVPISVGGRLWGVVVVSSSQEEPLPADTEARLAGFTELAATAIANAESQAALAASRARIVATADQTRRRIERDLHDGAQQHLVSLELQLREARIAVPPGAGVLAQQLDDAVTEVNGVLEELRETARGLHPAVLAEGGLRPALTALARRSAVPVRLDLQLAGRLPERAEIAAYYVVAETLTNTAKHAHATTVHVQVTAGEDILHVRVRDNGIGGAVFGHGSGLVGLRDRTEALGGQFWLHSPPGAGTVLEITLPLGGPVGRQLLAGLSPAERGRHVGEDAVDDVSVVVDAKLVGHGEQERVGGRDRLVLLELLDQHIRLRSVGAAEDRLSLRVDEPDLVGVLVAPAKVLAVPVGHQGEDAPAHRHPRLALVTSLLPRVTEYLDLLSLLQVEGFVRLVADQGGTLHVHAQLGRPGGGPL
jgi:signal transduction histidine kinase